MRSTAAVSLRLASVLTMGLTLPAAASAQLVEVARGQTSVALDTEALEGAGLVLSGVSDEVIVPGALPDSVAFPINPRDAEPPLLPTTFVYDPADVGSVSGTIEHDGVVFFNDDAVSVGNFTIGFDPTRVGTLGGRASGFFVESTTGVEAVLFDLGNPSLLLPTETSLTVETDVLVSPEFAAFLGDEGLAGADVGDSRVDAKPLVAVVGGQTSVALDTEALEGAGLVLSGVSDEVIVPGALPDSVAFPINPRDAETPLLPTTFAYDPDVGSVSGTLEHAGQVFFTLNGDPVTVGNFTIGFDPTRMGTLGGLASGFFVEDTSGDVQDVVFDLGNPSLLIPTETSLTVETDVLVSPEFAAVLGDGGLAGVDVGDSRVDAVPEPGAAALGLAALGTLVVLGRGRRGAARARPGPVAPA